MSAGFYPSALTRLLGASQRGADNRPTMDGFPGFAWGPFRAMINS